MTGRSPDAPLRIALLGLGTVAREVARALTERVNELRIVTGGRELQLVALGVRDPGRSRGLELPPDLRLTDDLADVAGSPDADVVVELLGGLDPAEGLLRHALESGHGVITANKALLARRGLRLEALARSRELPLRFEAAVGGGIPILGPLASDLAANRWSSVRAILNGTTNYILSAMADQGQPYADVLADAQARGYAEADPAGDVEGRDAADKLAILTRFAFGSWIDVDAIPRAPDGLDGPGRPGISGVTGGDLARAREAGLMIRLLAQASRVDGELRVSVVPTAVATGGGFGRTDGVENRIELRGEPIGRVAFSGPGAGGGATSSAVLGDLIAIARGAGSSWAGLPPAIPARLVADAGRLDGSGPTLRTDTTRYPVLEEQPL